MGCVSLTAAAGPAGRVGREGGRGNAEAAGKRPDRKQRLSICHHGSSPGVSGRMSCKLRQKGSLTPERSEHAFVPTDSESQTANNAMSLFPRKLTQTAMGGGEDIGMGKKRRKKSDQRLGRQILLPADQGCARVARLVNRKPEGPQACLAHGIHDWHKAGLTPTPAPGSLLFLLHDSELRSRKP